MQDHDGRPHSDQFKPLHRRASNHLIGGLYGSTEHAGNVVVFMVAGGGKGLEVVDDRFDGKLTGDVAARVSSHPIRDDPNSVVV
jgi:hypothetical protein